MKKNLLFSLVLALPFLGLAQPIDEINESLAKQNYAGARQIADKYMSEPKNQNKPDAWYFKGFTYKFSFKDGTLQDADKLRLGTEALEAFKQYVNLEPKQTRLKLENNASFRDLYFDFYDFGIKQFNNHDYEAAFQGFKTAIDIKDLILEKKYEYAEVKFSKLDTNLVVNAGMAAAQSKHEGEAIAYFRQITDADVSNKEVAPVYEFLADYYSKNKEEEKMKEILAKGRKYFPEDDFWDSLELRAAEGTGDEKAIRAKYEERIAATPGNFVLLYDYALVLYKTLYEKDDTAPKDPEAPMLSEKLTATLKEAIKVDKGIDATVLMSGHLFNALSEYSGQAAMVKGSKPEDVKKRNELKQKTIKAIDEFAPYGDAALKYFESQETLKPAQKATYRNIASYMAEAYGYKGDSAKEALYESKRSDPKMRN